MLNRYVPRFAARMLRHARAADLSWIDFVEQIPRSSDTPVTCRSYSGPPPFSSRGEGTDPAFRNYVRGGAPATKRTGIRTAAALQTNNFKFERSIFTRAATSRDHRQRSVYFTMIIN